MNWDKNTFERTNTFRITALRICWSSITGDALPCTRGEDTASGVWDGE